MKSSGKGSGRVREDLVESTGEDVVRYLRSPGKKSTIQTLNRIVRHGIAERPFTRRLEGRSRQRLDNNVETESHNSVDVDSDIISNLQHPRNGLDVSSDIQPEIQSENDLTYVDPDIDITHRDPPKSRPSEFASSPTERYLYQPLPIGRSIRILLLYPGSGSDHIKCSLRPVLLEDFEGGYSALSSGKQGYSALSYVWGPEDPSHTIEVDGCALKIRDNLFTFLTRLRQPNISLDLWADAICIDQDSTAERNHQVQQMGNIYKNSHMTLLWLGHGDNDVDNFFRWMKTDDFTAREVFRDPAILKGFIFIRDHDYWTRLWIVQEVILSLDVSVYIYDRVYPWDAFVQYYNLAIRSTNQRKYFDDEYIRRQLNSSTINGLDRQRRVVSTARHFSDLLAAFYNCKCFDIRDRVFGLLGLDTDFALDVDYNLSPLQLFEKIVRTYPVRCANGLARNLYTALNISSEVDLATNITPNLTIPMRVEECGVVMRQNGKLKCVGNPEYFLVSDSDLEEGDQLYVFTLYKQFGDRHLILRQSHKSGSDTNSQTSTPEKTYYFVQAKRALIGQRRRGVTIRHFSNIDWSISRAYTFLRPQPLFRYGSLILDIPILALPKKL
jgi:hypothetical protein